MNIDAKASRKYYKTSNEKKSHRLEKICESHLG
jgi:hypothetical protein